MFARSRNFLVAMMLLLGCGVCSAATVGITVGGNTGNVFTPSSLTINAGDTVIFTNAGGFHNAVINNLFRCANGCDGDGSGGNGNPSSNLWSFQHTFSTAGTFNYYCEQHGTPTSGMHGTLTVNAVQNTINLGGYMSGNWFDPAPNQSGHGFQFEFTNAPGSTAGTKTLVAIWFVFTPDGNATWIYGQGDWDPTRSTATIPAELYSGAKFPPNYNSADRQQLPFPPGWGTLTFTFSDCNNGTASWHSDVLGYNLANDTPIPIQRLTQIDGTTCP